MNQPTNEVTIPLDKPYLQGPEECLSSLTSGDLDAYFEKSVPAGRPNFKGTTPEQERKRFLVINPVHLIDRDNRFGESAWMEMVSHHLFPGHSSCNMVFEQFYAGEMLNLPEYLAYCAECEDGSASPFVVLILSWLHRNGYHYVDQETLHSNDGEVFDGVLLDICW